MPSCALIWFFVVLWSCLESLHGIHVLLFVASAQACHVLSCLHDNLRALCVTTMTWFQPLAVVDMFGDGIVLPMCSNS